MRSTSDEHAVRATLVITIHLRSPIIRDEAPPVWRLVAEGPDAVVIRQQLEFAKTDRGAKAA